MFSVRAVCSQSSAKREMRQSIKTLLLMGSASVGLWCNAAGRDGRYLDGRYLERHLDGGYLEVRYGWC